MNIVSRDQNTFNLSSDYFGLKIPVKTLQKEFDVRVLSPSEIYGLESTLANWQIEAIEKANKYSKYKATKVHSKNHVNPFINLYNMVTRIKMESRSQLINNIYFASYDRKTNQLQALAIMNCDVLDSRVSYNVSFLTTHPKNIRTRCNPKEQRTSGAASSVMHAIANWKNPNLNEEVKVESVTLSSLKGSRSFYQKIGLKPQAPPSRTHWILPISEETKREWQEGYQEFICSSALDYSDKTEETSDET